MASGGKHDKMKEVLVNGKRKFECLVCARQISSKQNVLQHLHLVHNMSPVKRVKKLYLDNKELKIPERTLGRWKRKQKLVDSQCSELSSKQCEESFEENFPSTSHNTDQPQEMSDTLSGASISDSEESSSMTTDETDDSGSSTATDFSDTESDIESVSQNISSDKTKIDKSFQTNDMKALKIVSCFQRHNLTISASKDITETMKSLFQDSENASILNYEYLMSFVGKHQLHEVHYCEICSKVFSQDPDSYSCSTENCDGYRYKGPLSKQTSKDRQPRKCFIIADIKKQLKDLLESPGVMEDINQHIMMAKSRMECQNDTIKDITDGSAYRKLLHESLLHNAYTLTGVLNTDGVNLYSSSKTELWPLFLAINELNPRARFSRQNLLLIGVWQGKGKPPFQSYLKSVSPLLNDLCNEGIHLVFNDQDITVRLKVVIGVFDLPAKAAVLNMMYFNGEYACVTCEEPGQTVNHARYYPDRKGQYRLRTNEEVHVYMNEGTKKKPVKGFKGTSGLSSIDSYNIVDGTVPDYMHGVLLGITSNLMSKWFSPTKGDKQYFIGKDLKKISKRLQSIRPPACIERLPRDLEKHYTSLKATELQSWLLFYGIPCLLGILPDAYLNHFSYLSESIYILLGDNITQVKLQRAQQLLDLFYSLYKDLYGTSGCGLNVHNTCAHLVHYVKLWGPLWAWSCFSFEDSNAMLLQAVHGTGTVTKQLMWYKQIQATLRHKSLIEVDSRAWKITYKATNCDVCGKMTPFELSGIDQDILEKLEVDDQKCVKIIERISLQGQQFSSSIYARMKKRICSYVLYDNSKIGSIKYFAIVTTSDTVYAVLDIYEVSNDTQFSTIQAAKHIIPVNRTGNECVIPVDRLTETAVYIKVCAEISECVALMPSNQGHGIFK